MSMETTTLIRALHSRFEANSIEYDRIDSDSGDNQTAKMQSQAEADAIRYTILMQVPGTFIDAMILQYHAQLESQMRIGAVAPDPDADERLQLALETVFDFMACHTDQDHGEIGKQFQLSCNRVFHARHHRSGDMI